MKIYVLFTGMRAETLEERTRKNVLDAVQNEFQIVFPGIEPPEMCALNGKAEKYDIVFALEEYPAGYTNPIQRVNQMAQNLAARLYDILPASCGYSGRVKHRLAKEIPNLLDEDISASANQGQGGNAGNAGAADSDFNEYLEIARQFEAEEPKFTFDRLVISEEVEKALLSAIAVLENREVLFDQWGLGSIMSPSVLLNLYGPSGTGKSMAAEAIANRLGKKIIRATYADIESKFHGEGPKRLKGIFLAAKQQDAVLFIDEADSMLSERLGNVTQGSEQAINSMRSQLLISLENHDGIVIFATNLIKNYDKAFLTRLICIEIERPDQAAREKIWYNHLYPVGDVKLNIPLAQDIDLKQLSEYDFSGRDIRVAVKQACINAVLAQRDMVTQEDLVGACEKTVREMDQLERASHEKTQQISPERKQKIMEQTVKMLRTDS